MNIPADFRGFAGDPRSEIEVVFLFGLLYDHLLEYMELPFVVTEINDAFPDCEAINTSTGNVVHIEFELKSSHYTSHRHPLDGCDYIVCWEDDWPGSPIPVVSLKKMVESMGLTGKRYFYVPAHGSIRQTFEGQKDKNPQTYDAIRYFLEVCVPEIRKKYPDFYTDERQTRHFVFRNRAGEIPLLEINPNGKLFGKSVSEAVRMYGDSVRVAATRLKDLKDSIGALRKTEHADMLKLKLEGLLDAISKRDFKTDACLGVGVGPN